MEHPTYRHADLYRAFRCAQLFEFEQRTAADKPIGEYDLGHETRAILEDLLPRACGYLEGPLGKAYELISDLPRHKRLRLPEGADPADVLVREKLCAAGVLYAAGKWAGLACLASADYQISDVIDTPIGRYEQRPRLRQGNIHYFFKCYGTFDDDSAVTLERDPTWAMEVARDEIAMVVPVVLGRRQADSYDNPWVRRWRLSNGQQVHSLKYRDPASGEMRTRRQGEREVFQSTEEIIEWVDALWAAYGERGDGGPFSEGFRSMRRVAEDWEACRKTVERKLQQVGGLVERDPFACHYPGRCPFEAVCWR